MRRLVVLASAVAVLALFVAVFPTRTWLSQRASLAAASSQLTRLDRQNTVLADQARQLGTDSEVERLARADFGLVMPSEKAYAILPPAASSAKPGVWAPAPATWAGAGPAQSALDQAERPLGQRPPTTASSQKASHKAGGGLWAGILNDLAFWR